MKGPSAMLQLVTSPDGARAQVGRLRQERQFREFLPAALEILETPPSPAGRTLAWVLCLIAATGIVWASLGKVNIVAVASGKIVAQMRTKLVQPFETATVRAILVSPGQRVNAGEALIELDPTAAKAERQRAENDLRAAELDQARLEAFLDGATAAVFSGFGHAEPNEIKRAQAQLTAQNAERVGKLASIAQERLQRIAERESLQQTQVKVEQTLPLVAQRAEIRRKAAAGGYASIIADLESQQLLTETKSELEINRAKIASLDAAIEALDHKAAAAEAEIWTTALADLSRARERARAASESLQKAIHRTELQTLRSPIAGTVQQLHVTTVGSVVTPAQQLLSVVPDDDGIEIEAVLENRDVGFVAAGQKVELKIDAFPFTRYGLLRGTVTAIDRDAEATPVGQSARGSQRAADEIQNVETGERLRYTVRIAVEPKSLDVDGHPAVLLPGMSVKAEILTGERRIVDFLLAPLREHIHDSLRER
jgi:HlyD family secretion protein/hemolysin D